MYLQAMVVARHHMEAEDMVVATEVAATEIRLDLVVSPPGGKCHHHTLWRLFSKYSGKDRFCLTRSWHLASMLDHSTVIPILFVRHLDFRFFTKLLPTPAFFPSLFDMLGSAHQAVATFTTERRCNCSSARIIDSVGVYPFRPIGLDTLHRPGA